VLIFGLFAIFRSFFFVAPFLELFIPTPWIRA